MDVPAGILTPFSLWIFSTSALAATLAYLATISLERVLRAGPMTGHPVARSVKTESDGKRGEVAVERERRVEGLVCPRKGQAALKRMKDESLSIHKETRKQESNKSVAALFNPSRSRHSHACFTNQSPSITSHRSPRILDPMSIIFLKMQ